jgi:hypothetical protein
VATGKGKTGTISAFAVGPRKTKKNLRRDKRKTRVEMKNLRRNKKPVMR